jgi:hypothetical protein
MCFQYAAELLADLNTLPASQFACYNRSTMILPVENPGVKTVVDKCFVDG